MKVFDRVMDWLEARPLYQIYAGVLLALTLLVFLAGCDNRSMICASVARNRIAVIEKCSTLPSCKLTTDDLRELDHLRSDNVIYIKCGDDR